MLNDFTGSIPYFLVGLVIYLMFRALVWLLYYRGKMKAPIWHELGMFLLALCFLALFCTSVTPALGFSLKPSLKLIHLVPVRGTIDMAKADGISSVIWAIFCLEFYVTISVRRSVWEP